MALPFLQPFGLTEKESEIYEILLKRGVVAVGAIIKESGLKRATVYKSLYELEKKKLVQKEEIKKIIHFRPEPPQNLLELAESQTKSQERAREDLRSALPDLVSQYILSVERPIIRTFEGLEGIKEVFNDIYSPKKEPVYGCADIEIADKALPGYIMNKLIPLRIKNKVFAKTFAAKSPQTIKMAQKDPTSLRETILLDKDEFPLPAEIDVYEDKVAILSFAKGQFAGVLLQNKDIATSLKTIFRIAFEKRQGKNPNED